MSILDMFGRQRIGPEAKILAPGERMNQRVICPHCEKEIEEGHDMAGCARKGMSRRVFFGIFGASAAALALRSNGVPLPTARVQVRAHAGDMFEVETLNPFTLAWAVAKDKPFRSDDGVLSTGGILEFHGQDVARPDKWLRVIRRIPEIDVLAVLDKVTGRPVNYKIIRCEEADKRVGLAEKRVMQEHYAAARAINRDFFQPLLLPSEPGNYGPWSDDRKQKIARSVEQRFGRWGTHNSVNRLAWGHRLVGPKGMLPT